MKFNFATSPIEFKGVPFCGYPCPFLNYNFEFNSEKVAFYAVLVDFQHKNLGDL